MQSPASTPTTPFTMVGTPELPTVLLPLDPRSSAQDLPQVDKQIDEETKEQFLAVVQDFLDTLALSGISTAWEKVDKEADERLRKLEEGRQNRRERFKQIFSTTWSSSPDSYSRSPNGLETESEIDSHQQRFGLLRGLTPTTPTSSLPSLLSSYRSLPGLSTATSSTPSSRPPSPITPGSVHALLSPPTSSPSQNESSDNDEPAPSAANDALWEGQDMKKWEKMWEEMRIAREATQTKKTNSGTAMEKRCWRCKSKRHIKKDCPWPQRLRVTAVDSDDDDDNLPANPTITAHRSAIAFMGRKRAEARAAAQYATEQMLYWEHEARAARSRIPTRLNQSWRVDDIFHDEGGWGSSEWVEGENGWEVARRRQDKEFGWSEQDKKNGWGVGPGWGPKAKYAEAWGLEGAKASEAVWPEAKGYDV